MNNKMKRVGPISVYLTREQVNALLYLLDCFPAADSNSIFARDAEKLKRKILLHGRKIYGKGGLQQGEGTESGDCASD